VDGKWKTNEGHEYTTKDCAPKRSMILSQQIYDFMTCARKDYNEMRNVAVKVLQLQAMTSGVELIVEGDIVNDNLDDKNLLKE
jgi:hypothetical protein